MNVLFYGNCQIHVIQMVLNLDRKIFPTQVILTCYNTDVSEHDMQICVQSSDVVIMHPISDNYRDKKYLSSSYIIYNCKPSCKIIMVNNCHFDFYYFDTKTLANINYDVTPYHDTNLNKCYKDGHDVEYYKKNYVNNYSLKNEHELNELANSSLKELENRMNIMRLYKQLNPNKNINCIAIHDFIRNNYKKKLLFYTVNHPSHHLVNYICENIVNLLGIKNTINYGIDHFRDIRCILYDSLQSVLEFDIKQHTPFIGGKETIEEIYDIYSQIYAKNNIVL